MVVTVFGDEETVLRAIEAGATGYLLKDGTARAIGDAVAQLLDGGSPISAPIARLLLRRRVAATAPAPDVPAETDARAPVLTPREHEVLNLVAKGFSFAEIARLLGLSPHNRDRARAHTSTRSSRVGSRSEAVFEAVQQGLIRLRE